METKEAILETISELNNADSSISKNTDNDVHTNIFIDIKEADEVDSSDVVFSDEIATLLSLKEKSLVLFEGLKNTHKEDLEIKLEMVISYLEYQLYIIEDRLKNLQESSNTDL